MAHLYQHLVRYTEVKVRHAVRLEHAPSGNDDVEDVHPLARTLASDAGLNELDKLLEREADRSVEAALQANGSLAASYVRQLQHIPVPGTDMLPGPWRGYRLMRQPIQLSFDFDEELPLD